MMTTGYDTLEATCRCGAMAYPSERAADRDRMVTDWGSFPRTCPACRTRATNHEYREGSFDPFDFGRCSECDGRPYNHR